MANDLSGFMDRVHNKLGMAAAEPPPSKEPTVSQADQLRREKQKAKTKLWQNMNYAEGAIRGNDVVLRVAEQLGLTDAETVAVMRRLAAVLRDMKAAKDVAEPLLDRAMARTLRELNEASERELEEAKSLTRWVDSSENKDLKSSGFNKAADC